jgi:hypothetical protein
MFSLEGKTAVVIGGTTGIGHAISLGLADAGADVVASSRRTAEVGKTADEIEAKGRKTLRMASDVRDRKSLEALRDEVISTFGKVDILFNCAGITKRAPTLDFSEETWSDILEINLTGTLRGCQVFGKHMLERKYGRIINIASLSTFVGLYEVAAYGASTRAGIVQDRVEREPAGGDGSWTRIFDSHADGEIWKNRRTCRSSNLPCIRCRRLCSWGNYRCGWRISRERSEPVVQAGSRLMAIWNTDYDDFE